MSVKLNLMRMGRRNVAFYRVVAKESGTKRDGRFLELLGYYNPLLHPPVVKLKEDRVFEWLGKGAIPSDTLRSLLIAQGLWAKWNLAIGPDDMVSLKAVPKPVKKQRKKKRDKETGKTEGGSAPAPAPSPAPAPAPAKTDGAKVS